jgi:predicted ArsR family transcriptional regulator
MPEVSEGVYIPHDPTDTQVEAAQAASHHAKYSRELVIAALKAAEMEGVLGLNDIEIASVTGLYLNTAAPSRFALMKKGLVEDSGQRRKNERGRNMIVWRLTAKGRA